MASTQQLTSDGSLSRPYRVVQLTSTSDIGGTERMVRRLAEHLDRNLFEPLVLPLVGGGGLIEECRQHGIEAEHLRCRHPLDRRAWRRFREIIRRKQVALVHLYGLRANLPGRWQARRAGARAVVAGIRSTDPWRKWYHVRLDRATARWVDCFISNSRAGREMAMWRERFHPSRIVTIHSGVREMPAADSFDRVALRRKFDVKPEARPVVAVVANLGPEKRHRDLVDAAVLLKGHFPKIVFLCAGRDQMDGFNQRYAAERGAGDHFRWLDFVSDVAEVVAAADFVALASSHEGLPASLLEAMSMGRTAVATSVGGVGEIVQSGINGLLAPANNPSGLASAIEKLATDKTLRRQFEIKARETVQRDFSIESMVRKTERVYLDLIEGGKPKDEG